MRILIVDHDPVFATHLEDLLTLGGHAVEVVADGTTAVRRALDRSADLVVVARELPAASGLEVLRALRSQTETRTLPVVMLASDEGSAARIEALRAGADDVVAKASDIEELTLRIERLLGVREEAAGALGGDLGSHPVWEIIQYLAGAGKSGFLVVRGEAGSGRLQVARGQVAAARFKALDGAEAFLAIAGLREGRFRFVTPDGAADAATPAERLPVAEILMQAAYFDDELARRQRFLPATGAPLRALRPPPEPPEGLAELPLAAVYERVRERPGTRLFDLLAEGALAAPQKLRLAVAWLVEQRSLTGSSEGPGQRHPNTVEINSSMLLDGVVDDLLTAARQSGLDKAILPYLVLASPGVWGDVQALFRAFPGWQRLDPVQQMSEKIDAGSGASGVFQGTAGKLSLQIRKLTADAAARGEAMVPGCAGVLLWLDRPEALAEIEGIVRRLDEAGEAATGVVVATSSAVRQAALGLVGAGSRWQVVDLPPGSLLGLLRLLRHRRSP
jgi:DNA-binding response OmpR family regulator